MAGEGIEPKVLIVRAPGVATKLIVLSHLLYLFSIFLSSDQIYNWKNKIKKIYHKLVFLHKLIPNSFFKIIKLGMLCKKFWGLHRYFGYPIIYGRVLCHLNIEFYNLMKINTYLQVKYLNKDQQNKISTNFSKISYFKALIKSPWALLSIHLF